MQRKKFYRKYLDSIRTAKLFFASKILGDILSLRSAIEKAGYRIRGARELDNDENVFILLADNIEVSVSPRATGLFPKFDNLMQYLFVTNKARFEK